MDGVRRKSLSEYLINNTGLFMDGVRRKPSPDIRKHSIRFDEDNFMQWLIVYYQNQGKIQISLIPWLMYRSRNRGILFSQFKNISYFMPRVYRWSSGPDFWRQWPTLLFAQNGLFVDDLLICLITAQEPFPEEGISLKSLRFKISSY